MFLIVHQVRISEEPLQWTVHWSLLMQSGTFLFAAFLVSAGRELTESLDFRVRERTAELEREIQERRQAEGKLLKTMQQFRQMAENISDAFWMWDVRDSRMVYVSPAYEKIWGRRCRDLYQNPATWLESVHSEDRTRMSKIWENRQSMSEHYEEYRIVRPDGSLRWIRDRAFPIHDRTGKIIRTVGIAEDFTERYQLERQILKISDREQARIGQDLHDSL